MTGLSIPPLVMAGINAYVGLHHLAIYSRVRRSREHLTFALLALAIAGYCFCAAGLYNAVAPENGRGWQIAEIAFLALAAPAMLFFVSDYTGSARRRFVRVWSVGFGGVALAALIGGTSLVWSHVPAIKHATLPLGLSATYQEVAAGPLMAALTALALGVYAFGFVGAVGLYRRGERKRAARLGAAVALFFVAFANDTLMALGLIHSIYTLEYAFLGLVVLMADGLASDLAKSAAIEQSLRESEERYRQLVELSPDAIAVHCDGEVVLVNSAALRLLGADDPAKLLGRPVLEFVHPDARSIVVERIGKMLKGGTSVPLIAERFLRLDGSSVDVEVAAGPFIFRGRPAVQVVFRDVTDRRQAEEALRESELQFRALAETTGLGILIMQDEHYIYANPAAERITGYTIRKLAGMKFWELVHPDFRELVRQRAAARLAGERDLPTRYEIKGVVKGGAERWFSLTSGTTELGGKPALVASITDVTEEHRLRDLQAAIYEISEATQATGSLDELFRAIHAIIGRLMAAKNFYIALHDPATNLISFPYFVDEVDTTPEPFPLGRGMTSYIMRTGQPLLATPEVLRDFEERGEIQPLGAASVDWLGVPLKVQDKILGVLAVQSYSGKVRYREVDKEVLSYVSAQVAQAIARKRVEQALSDSEERFRLAMDATSDGLWDWNIETGQREYNPAYSRMLGYEPHEFKEMADSWAELLHPEDRDRVLAINQECIEGVRKNFEVEYRFISRDGSWKWVLGRAKAVSRDARGRARRMVGTNVDITERKRAEEALEQSRAQLLQAQKMEAVGRLAGGVAHDFNNVLQSMLSHVQLLRAADPSPRRVALVGAELEQQIKRASALTRQLLVFSRQESVRPDHLDLNEVIEQASGMLRRLLRENIAFHLQLAEGSLVLEADRGQLDQVLMNLVVNASDAVSVGGTITLRTGREGENVWLEVEDTGHGIPAEVLPRIFEPFFTTKAVGQGTGLGLSVVHGIVTAWGGRVEVRSAVGTGTMVRVLFPSAAPGTAPLPRPVDIVGDILHGEGERILLVEDEQSAREALAEMLTMLGYQVTAAASAEEAGRLPVGPAYDLLLTDFLLPGANGGELAKGLLGRWPNLAVIVMSGYTDDEAIRRSVREGKVRFLQKPFDMSAVAREIRAALAE